MTEKKDVLISIVNGNNQGFIYDCIASILKYSKGFSFDVVVIDNCTGDENLHKLEAQGVRVIRNREPLGFSANHSQVLPLLAAYKYILIFNDDAFLLNNCIKIMKDALEADQRIAIAGCRTIDSHGRLQPSCAPFLDIRYFFSNLYGIDGKGVGGYSAFFENYIDYGKTQLVDWVSGCCMLVRSSFIKKHGFLDPDFFMFVEDVDICRRVMLAGHRVIYIAEAEVLHYGGGSSKDEQKTKMIKPFLFIEKQRSRLRYLKKVSIPQYSIYFLSVYLYLFLKTFVDFLRGNFGWCRKTIKILLNKPLV